MEMMAPGAATDVSCYATHECCGATEQEPVVRNLCGCGVFCGC
jgi:hypothetical protein